MAKKRKSENAGLDEVERTLYTTFCTAANSISQLYTQAQNQQKVAFQAGERHAVEKLYTWLHREHHAGSNISTAEILNYLQSELDGEEMTMSPGPQYQNQFGQQHHQQQQSQQLMSSQQAPLNAGGFSGLGHLGRVGAAVDQSKISVFTVRLLLSTESLSPSGRTTPPWICMRMVVTRPSFTDSERRPGKLPDFRHGREFCAGMEDVISSQEPAKAFAVSGHDDPICSKV
ncbi:hypothetical protein R1sor_027333 [Riccia sorocarpa]|uniref:Holocarboxylase synthetase n=1 Tax=Riccia sorocarpa TaxID=122646 RepID=A0ABD3GDX7_9MARC